MVPVRHSAIFGNSPDRDEEGGNTGQTKQGSAYSDARESGKGEKGDGFAIHDVLRWCIAGGACRRPFWSDN
jgi:hypothetical protein